MKKILPITILLSVAILLTGCSYKIVKNDKANDNYQAVATNVEATTTNLTTSTETNIISSTSVPTVTNAIENNTTPKPKTIVEPTINNEAPQKTPETPPQASEENFNSAYLSLLDQELKNWQDLMNFADDIKELPNDRISYMRSKIANIDGYISISPNAEFRDIFNTVKELYQNDIAISNAELNQLSKYKEYCGSFYQSFNSVKIKSIGRFVSRQEFISTAESLKDNSKWKEALNAIAGAKDNIVSSAKARDAKNEPLVDQVIATLDDYYRPKMQYNPPSVYVQPIKVPTYTTCYYNQSGNLGTMNCYGN